MDKLQKFEYMQSIESYLEDNQVYELFEGLLKQLVINRPEQPLDFLIQKLSKPDCKSNYLNIWNSQEDLPGGSSR
jgi:adenylate kinase